jgi:hypothetical protein
MARVNHPRTILLLPNRYAYSMVSRKEVGTTIETLISTSLLRSDSNFGDIGPKSLLYYSRVVLSSGKKVDLGLPGTE